MRMLRCFLVLAAFSVPLCADTLLVANRGGSTITLIDPATMTLLGTVAVGFDPHEIAVTADGSRADVSNYGNAQGTTLSVIDIAARTKVKDVSIAPLRGPHGIVERNGKIWFTAEASQSVGRYDPVADRVDWVGRTSQTQTRRQLRVRAAAGPARFEVQCAESVAGVKSNSHGRELSVRVLSDAVRRRMPSQRRGPAQVRTARIYADEMVLCMRFHSEQK